MSLKAVARLTRTDVAPQPLPLSFKVNNFDLIRLFAAVQVAVLHSCDRFSQAIPSAIEPLSWYPGVPIFFVISGYLISASFERSDSLVRYARNRALRIFPGLWGCLIATVTVATIAGFPVLHPSGVTWFIAQMVGLIYTPAFLDQFGDGTYNGSLWTIPIELQFYATLPAIYFLFSQRWRTRAIATLFLLFLAIGIGTRLAFPELSHPGESLPVKLLRYTFLPRFYLFLFGVLLQRLHVHTSPWIRGKGLLWLALHVLFRMLAPQAMIASIISELMVAIVVVSLAYTAPTLSERLLRGNDISYGVYLYHGLAINALLILSFPRAWYTTPVLLALSATIGLMSWVLIERPAIRRKRRALTVALPVPPTLSQT